MNINKFSTYSIHEKSLLIAYLCYYSYSDNASKNKRSFGVCVHKTNKVLHMRHKSIQYHLYETETHQFIIIRGTDMKMGINEAFSDLLVSAYFIPKKTINGVYCHGGYASIGNKILNQLIDNGCISSAKRIVIGGHSLGGAIAKYISIFLPSHSELYTFGAPQISRRDYFSFPNNFVEAHYMNERDWVCHYPSTLYDDERKVFLLYENNKVVKCKMKRRGIAFPLICIVIHTIFFGYKLLDDHSILRYIKRISELIQKDT